MYAVIVRVGNIIPKSVKCIHSAAKKRSLRALLHEGLHQLLPGKELSLARVGVTTRRDHLRHHRRVLHGCAAGAGADALLVLVLAQVLALVQVLVQVLALLLFPVGLKGQRFWLLRTLLL